ncbi:MAG: hypothetical protein ACI95C_000128 [Pseudohongiellaceae bacterium]|jgi:hypothetical protein
MAPQTIPTKQIKTKGVFMQLASGLLLFLLASTAHGQPISSVESYGFEAPHHLSIFLGDTHIDGEGNNLTIGIDYEYRVSELLGLGVVVERAGGEIDATTALAVADIHFSSGVIMQVGPGFESHDSEQIFVARIGILYEFELGEFTLSPQLHWDYHAEGESALVAGLAFGFGF